MLLLVGRLELKYRAKLQVQESLTQIEGLCY